MITRCWQKRKKGELFAAWMIGESWTIIREYSGTCVPDRMVAYRARFCLDELSKICCTELFARAP